MDQHVYGIGIGIGIGIVEFFKGKELLITGATGFLGKVVVEKILREIPEVGKIYLLIRATNAEVALHRLKTEIINTELFKLLQQTYGDCYEDFMLSKLIPVAGNVCDSALGLQHDLVSQISNKVDVIINSAANTTWDERFDVSVETNMNGPCNLLTFAKMCTGLKLFLHVSTVYVHGERVGKIMEKPFHTGESIAREKYFQDSPNSSALMPPPILDVEHELQLAFSTNSSTHEMRELGLIRAKTFGWHNTYEFTKAMGEMMIDSMREDIPVVIIRPSTIESTLNDPFPGWIQGRRSMEPLLISYGQGKLPGFVGNPSCVMDIIPVDMVANVILAAIAKHGSESHKLRQDIKVYHVGSSAANPLKLQDLFRMFYEHFNIYPEIDPVTGVTIKVSPLKIFNSFRVFSETIRRYVIQQMTSSRAINNTMSSSKLEMNSNKLMNRLEHMAKVYMPYGFDRGRFDTSNMEKLMEEMSDDEKKKFSIDVRGINWDHYIKNIHIPGVKKHVMMKVKLESML